jgi:quercetin dioxygenase-like cupin family protein
MAEDRAFLAETETIVPILHPPGSGKVVGVLGGQSTIKVLSEQTGGAYALLEQQVPPGLGPPLHVHRHETEIFCILEGLFEITLGDRTVEAPPGALAVGPRDIPHIFRNVGPTPSKPLLTVIPGRFSNYFLEVDGLPDEDLDTIKAFCAKYDVEVLE